MKRRLWLLAAVCLMTPMTGAMASTTRVACIKDAFNTGLAVLPSGYRLTLLARYFRLQIETFSLAKSFSGGYNGHASISIKNKSSNPTLDCVHGQLNLGTSSNVPAQVENTLKGLGPGLEGVVALRNVQCQETSSGAGTCELHYSCTFSMRQVTHSVSNMNMSHCFALPMS